MLVFPIDWLPALLLLPLATCAGFALLGLEIFGEVDDISLLSDELAGNFLLESYTTHIFYNITITFIVTHSR